MHLDREHDPKFTSAELRKEALGLIYTPRGFAIAPRRPTTTRLARARAGRNAQEWPMTPSGRIPSAHASWPLLRAKKAQGEEPLDALATHESRYHADYLRETV